jgi:hypothetical protein
MFTYNELIERVKTFNMQTNYKIDELVVGQDDFTCPSSEEGIIFYRGLKTDFSDSIDFYLASQHKIRVGFNPAFNDFSDAIFETELYQNITEKEFSEIVQKCTANLTKRFNFNQNGQWLGGMIMMNNWDDIYILRETSLEFNVFYWLTTA